MSARPTAALLTLLLSLPAAAEPRTLEQCVETALRDSGQVAEAQAKVDEWKARLREVKAVFYPKISAIAFAAPIFAETGNAWEPDVQRDYWKWGPYLSFEGMLMQPIYTFGQAAAGKRAAAERLEVEQARLEQARNALSVEVHRYYHLYLYVKSLTPTLEFARKTLDEAQARAQELYDSSQGGVTKADLAKLQYVATELAKYRVQAEIALPLALGALKHTMGLPETAQLDVADEKLPPLPEGEPPALAELVKLAWERRPEASQLRHGRKAALSLAEVERLSMFPVVGIAGQLSASWTPVRSDQKNPFAHDPWNDLYGGVALAMKWDFDPGKSVAREAGAQAMVAQLDALQKFATTGIPMEVRKARDEALQAARLAKLSEEGAGAARKWMVFAAAAYASGTGETKDLLEGVGAFAQGRKGYFDALLAAHLARAQLSYVTGGRAGAALPVAAPAPEAAPAPAAAADTAPAAPPAAD